MVGWVRQGLLGHVLLGGEGAAEECHEDNDYSDGMERRILGAERRAKEKARNQ
jgi:hypothetical protein